SAPRAHRERTARRRAHPVVLAARGLLDSVAHVPGTVRIRTGGDRPRPACARTGGPVGSAELGDRQKRLDGKDHETARQSGPAPQRAPPRPPPQSRGTRGGAASPTPAHAPGREGRNGRRRPRPPLRRSAAPRIRLLCRPPWTPPSPLPGRESAAPIPWSALRCSLRTARSSPATIAVPERPTRRQTPGTPPAPPASI